MNNMTDEERFIYALSLPHVTANCYRHYINTLYASLGVDWDRRGETYLALKDFYYVDKGLVIKENDRFCWAINRLFGTVELVVHRRD